MTLYSEGQRAERAAAAAEDEIEDFLHDTSPGVIKALLTNRWLTEEHILALTNRKNLPPEIIEIIAKDRRWPDSYSLRLAIARNPRTPLFVSLSTARYLRLFDLADITRDHFIPIAFRQKIEAMIVERIPALPLGIKKTLARRAAGNVLFKLLQSRDQAVVQACLSNPQLMEHHLFKYICLENSIPETIRMIAVHPKWSCRPSIRMSLARNAHTPLSCCAVFFRGLPAQDLRELHADPLVPVSIKPLVHRELRERGLEARQPAPEEMLYELDDTEEEQMDFPDDDAG